MPSNLISGTSCSIYPINHPTLPVGLPAQEYKHHAFKSATTGAIQEIVTIESNENTAFEIKLEINPTAYSLLHQSSDRNNRTNPLKEDDYLVYIQLDGITIQRSKRHRSQNGPTIISGVYSTDMKSSRTFQFGKLHLVDPDDDSRICQDEKIIQALGTIQVNIVRCILGIPKPAPTTRRKPPPNTRARSPTGNRRRADAESLQTTNQMIFSERSKKACQLNTVGLGKLVSTPTGGLAPFSAKKTIRPVTREDPHPFLQFIFKYKPRSILEVEGIIAPPPPPPPSPPGNLSTSAGSKVFPPSVKGSTSHNHDYLSNSELHRTDLKASLKGNQEDEQKPNARMTKLNYILIDSDEDSDSSEAATKRKVTETPANGQNRASNGESSKTNHNRSVGGSGGKETTKTRIIKSENGGHDENRPQVVNKPSTDLQPTIDSKKRVRSLMTKNNEPIKRQSGAGVPPSTNNEANAQNEYKSSSKFRESRLNDVYLDDSSDDDDTIQDQIIGPNRANGLKDGPKHSNNLNHSKKRKSGDDEQTSRKGYNVTAIPIDPRRAKTTPPTTSNEPRRNLIDKDHPNTISVNFVDLTDFASD